MMDEQLRHHYLTALGVSSWLPQRPLPGAAPSPDWVWDFRYPAPPIPFAEEDYAGGAGGDAAAPVASRPRPQPMRPAPQDMKAARAMLARTLAAAEAEQPPASAPEPAADGSDASPVAPATAAPGAPHAAQQVPHFKLAFVTLGPLLLVDSLPPQGKMGFSEHHRNLLTAIARALCPDLPPCPAPSMLPWPTFLSKTIDQSRAQALIAVRHKLKRSLGSESRALLLFGEAAAQMVLERAEELDALRGVLFSYSAQVKALATRSLTEAMQVPGAKGDIWLDLQPLLRYLRHD